MKNPKSEIQNPKSEIDLQVEGLHCVDCAAKIEKTVGKLAGVESAAANFATGKVKIKYDPERIGSSDFVKSVEKIGYIVKTDVHTPTKSRPIWQRREFQFTTIAGLALAAGLITRFFMPNPEIFQFMAWSLRPSVLFYLTAVVFGAFYFSRKGWAAIRALHFNMDMLMSLAIVGAIVIQEYAEAASLAFLFSLAELLESHAIQRARQSLNELINLAPADARVRRDGAEVSVPASDLAIGDILIVRPGDRLAADGKVAVGTSSLDQSPITGESVPVLKSPGEKVFAGSINVEGYLEVRVTHKSSSSTLARIIHMIEEAEAQKAPSQRFVEKFARIYTPSVVGLAALVAIVPPLLMDASFNVWFIKALTLLVIACPCALVISTPVTVVSALTSASRNGVLIKGGVHLETMAKVKAIALDKTGTLTWGRLVVSDVAPLNGASGEELMEIAASLESRSEHPIAKAIVREHGASGLRPVHDFEASPGMGVKARIGETFYRIGRPEFFEDLTRDGEQAEALQAAQDAGKTTMLVGDATSLLGIIALRDEIREDARQAVCQLQQDGLEVVMITGDNEATAKSIAEELGIIHYHAGLLPEQKVEEVAALREKYGQVAMVGDGINDAPALARASVGIAMGVAGTDTALETADIALMSDDLRKLPYLIRLSRQANGVIKQNIWAAILIKFSLALGVFPGIVSLVVAVLVGDMGASLGVTSNAMRLARVK